MNLTQGLEVREVVVAVAYKNIDFGNILHSAARRLDHRLKIAQNLFILAYQVSVYDIAFRVTTGLTGQEEKLPTRDEHTMAEASWPGQRGRIDDRFLHLHHLSRRPQGCALQNNPAW